MTIWIATNGRPSNGAKALSSQPGFKRLRTGKGVKQGDLVVNWGSSQKYLNLPVANLILNDPVLVGNATNKLKAFQALSDAGVSVVAWTVDKLKARLWQKEDGSTIVVRQKLTGHSGEGIIVVEPGEETPDAPLYTRYIFKEKEYRVHVVGSKAVDTQRKIKDPDREVVTWKVRSHANGFIFARNNIDHDPARDELAVASCNALGLDFGAVDIIQDKKGNYYVLEVNTAPGLEGQTVERYAQELRNWGNNHDG